MDRARTAVRSLTAADVRGTRDIGRRARLELVFGVRHGRTTLVHAYAEPPFRVGRLFDALVDAKPTAHLIVASSAPGIFGGDALEQTVVVQAGARVRLTSQSALQVHPSTDGAKARLTSAYRVERGGHLLCEWDAMIPFALARLEQSVRIDLDEGATLLWSDAMMNGRERRGERWQFEHFAHELRLVRAGQLAYLERYCLEPRLTPVAGRWVGAAASYFGTVLMAGPSFTRESAERAHRMLGDTDGVAGAADLVEPDLIVLRMTSASGARFKKAREGAIRSRPLNAGFG